MIPVPAEAGRNINIVAGIIEYKPIPHILKNPAHAVYPNSKLLFIRLLCFYLFINSVRIIFQKSR